MLLNLWFNIGQAYAICNSIKLRREIRDLTNGELKQFKTIFRGLYDNSKFKSMVNLHAEKYNLIHNTPIFLPFHRVFINDFEQQFLSNTTFGLPFIDWTLDSNNVKNSIIFSDKYFGKNDANGNIVNSEFKGIIKRNPDIINGYTNNIKNTIVNSFVLYSNMSFMIELGIHALYHSKLHETMDSVYSPMDPLFFLHHSFIDKIWSEWTDIKLPNKTLFDNVAYHTNINVNSYLPGYTFNTRFALNASHFCYRYGQNENNSKGKSLNNNLPELALNKFLLMHNFTQHDIDNLQEFNQRASSSVYIKKSIFMSLFTLLLCVLK